MLKRINKYLEKDIYYESKICNIYFDSDNNDLIINSLEKPIFKEKLRLRSYGIPSMDDDVFFEIKTKYKGVVGKRRHKLKLSEFYDYLNNHSYDENNQILKEIDYFFKYYNLKPSIYISYNRYSYKGKQDDLRITFDYNLKSRRNNLNLEKGDEGQKYFKDKYYIMEIKTLGSIPLWLVESLSELKITPTSFSKYGNIYINEIKERFYA